MSAINVKLQRSDNTPWGFRIHGGVDFGQPLIILKVTAGSISAKQGLEPGDQILSINGQEALSIRHREAQGLIINAGNQVDLEVFRGDTSLLERAQTQNQPLNVQAPESNALASIIQASSAVSIAPVTPGWRGSKYTEESIKESIHSQSSVLNTGAIGVNFIKTNDKNLDLDKSEVLKMLKELEVQGTQTPTQPPPLSPSAAGLIIRPYEIANEFQNTQAPWANQPLSPIPRPTAPVK
ncbi:unnamed protein product [Orchesella dallaii]|uniref:PDZ domain-containing protein n=1 Tax=Orchesella dallaii TaxID=48710 RepID=A0ABP1RXM2_9HEXA